MKNAETGISLRSAHRYPYLSLLIPSFTNLNHRGISLDIPLQEFYPCISQNNFSIPTYTGISLDRSQVGLSLDIPVEVWIWQGVILSDVKLYTTDAVIYNLLCTLCTILYNIKPLYTKDVVIFNLLCTFYIILYNIVHNN